MRKSCWIVPSWEILCSMNKLWVELTVSVCIWAKVIMPSLWPGSNGTSSWAVWICLKSPPTLHQQYGGIWNVSYTAEKLWPQPLFQQSARSSSRAPVILGCRYLLHPPASRRGGRRCGIQWHFLLHSCASHSEFHMQCWGSLERRCH